LALVAIGLVFWLVSIGESKTTVLESSTTNVSGATSAAKRTAVTSKKVTTQPRERGSDAVVGVLVGTGGLLFLVFAFWNRIAEIGLPGGGSIKLKEAEAPAVGVEDAALALRQTLPEPELASAPVFAQMMTSASSHIVEKTKEIAVRKEGVVIVGLGAGDKWLLPNLFFLVHMLERWTFVSVLVFTESEDATAPLYIACTSPRALRDRLEVVRPELTQARAATADTEIDQAGLVFFNRLAEIQAPPAPAPEGVTWVTGSVLRELGGNAVTTASVEIKGRDELTVSELRAILDFPYRYVPATQARVLVATVDQSQVALRLARSATRSR
jgi:hypothetical protein